MPRSCSAEGPTSCSAARPPGQGNRGCSLDSCRQRSTSPRGAPGRADALPSVCLQRPCARPCVPASTAASASTTASRATPPIPAPASQASRGGRATWVSFCKTPPSPPLGGTSPGRKPPYITPEVPQPAAEGLRPRILGGVHGHHGGARHSSSTAVSLPSPGGPGPPRRASTEASAALFSRCE